MQARFCAAAHVDLDPLRQKGVDLRPGEKAGQGKPVAVGLPCRRGEYVVAARRQAAQQALVGCGQLDQVLGGHDQPLAIMWLGPGTLVQRPSPEGFSLCTGRDRGSEVVHRWGKIIMRAFARSLCARYQRSADMHVETQSESTIASGRKATLVSTIEPSKILDLTISKQTQYYSCGAFTRSCSLPPQTMVRALRRHWDSVWQCFSVSGPSIWAPGFCAALPS